MTEAALQWVFLIGASLCVGSFLNVVIYRLPLGLSVVRPGSSCPGCGKPIAAYDNIPVLSWLLLRGRCRRCSSSISVVYPAVELLSAVLAGLVLWRFGWRPILAPYLLMTFALVAVTFIDLEHQIIPDVITLGGLALFLLLALLGDFVPRIDWPIGSRDALIGAAFGAGVIGAIMAVYYLVTRNEGMGMGDLKLLAMTGALVGWRGVFLTLTLGSMAGTLLALPMMLLGRADRKTAIPFGPFLALGVYITLLFGRDILEAYDRSFGLGY